MKKPEDCEVTGTFNVTPAELPPPERIKKLKLEFIDRKDMKVYGKNTLFPADYVGNITFGMKRQYKIASVDVYPYRYNPVTRKLRVITGGTVEVKFKEESKGKQSPMRDAERDALTELVIREMVVNETVLSTYGAEPAAPFLQMSPLAAPEAIAPASVSNVKYSIVTTNQIVANCSQLSAFRSSLTSRGAIVTTITETQYGEPYRFGRYRAYAIQQKLAQMAAANEVSYVLLIGNPDINLGDVPMWGHYENGDYKPTDWFYADVILGSGESRSPEVMRIFM